jgi:hypothetical protein
MVLLQEVVVAPPALYLIPLKEAIRGDIKVAAQNCYYETKGAFTGEIRSVPIRRCNSPVRSHINQLLKMPAPSNSQMQAFPMSF